MARLPQPGGDQDTWGEVLNDFLSTAHNTDGTLKTDSVGPAQLKPSAVASANLADGSITTTKIADGTITDINISGSANISQSKISGLGAALNSKAIALTATAIKTSDYTAAANDLIPVDTTSGSVVITLPTAPADKSRVGVKMVIQGGANSVTITAGGSDVFNKTGGSTTLTLQLSNQSVSLQYASGSAIWYVTGDDLPLSQLDSRFVATTGGGKEGTSSSAAATGSTTVNLANGNVQKVTLNVSTTLTLTGSTASTACSLSLYLVQDATGSRAVSWPASVKWPSAIAPTLSTGANKVDLVVLETLDGGTSWYGTFAGADFR